MSTIPGNEAWRDAGLVENEEVVNLVEEASDDDADRDTDQVPEEYHPGSARPDRADEAAEADVAEQASAVPGGEDDYA
ncbi:hypothetical protein [Cellulosimicrobium arenosum]|uniref:Uncharacterized protein n=1 Tax=Cellulosimicrobium arenosum TaxID=2708133 RepID=A0A927G747_9MICO|nr:hypothetical protein [Cellulosimicrobium arenosum]MBD8078088.1 hypothetical protein [Cellulosimicrobium arenosum]